MAAMLSIDDKGRLVGTIDRDRTSKLEVETHTQSKSWHTTINISTC